MSTDRLDAQVEVKVPAQNGRKAYSYFRNVSTAKKGAAGAGAALVLGGLAAAAIALRKTPEESKAIPAPVPAPTPTQPISGISSPPSSKDILKAYGVKIGVKSAQLGAALAVRKGIGVAAEKIVSEMRKKERDNRYNNLQDEVRKRAEEIKKKKQEDIDADLASRTIDVKATSIDNILEAPKNQPPVSDRLPYQKPKPEVGGAMVLVGKAAEAPKAAEKPKPTRFREQDEFAEGDEPETPILINGKPNPKYYEAAKRGHIEPGEASRLARNISAERAGIALSKEDRSLSGFYSNDKIRAAGSRNLEKQIAKGEYLPPPDRLPSPNGVLPSTKPKFEIPRTLIPPVRSQSSLSSALTVTPSESPKNTGGAIAEPKKSRLTQIAGSAGAALGRIYRKGVNTYNASIERDRVAREKLASRTVDLNEVSRKVGSGARSVLNAVDGLAQRVKKSIAKEPPAIDVKAEEIKEPEPPRKMRGITIRALPQGGKRGRGRPKTKFGPKDFIDPKNKRQESLYSRIDSFVLSLK